MAVRQMAGVDAGFLYLETPTLHMHTIKVAVIDPSGFPGGYSPESVKAILAAALPRLPGFRRRVVRVPFEVTHPVWIEDPAFDLDNHVRFVRAPAPGDHAALCRVVGDIAATQLPQDRPLWEMAVVEGLADGRVGFVVKLHHALADGGAAVAMLNNVLTAEPGSRPTGDDDWVADTMPSRSELTRMALRGVLMRILMFPLVMWRALRGRLHILWRRMRGIRRGAALFRTPPTPWNGSLTENRVFATARLPLAGLKNVRHRADVSLNDVFLAVCAGGLRSYLQSCGVPTEAPLVSSVPVGTEKKDAGAEPRLVGNKVSTIFTLLPTNEADPLERLRIVHETTKGEKAELLIKGESMLEELAEYRPPKLTAWAMRTYSRHRLADRHRAPINLVTSNVPGPREPLQIGGAKLLEIYSVGPILEGIGLNVTGWSYADTLYLGLVACPEAIPDLDRLGTMLEAALAELLAATGADADAPAEKPESARAV